MSRRDRSNAGMRHRLAPVVALMALGAGMFAFAGSSSADVSAVRGGAFGYFTSVSLFGGPASPRGPAPTVTLPGGGSAVPITATAPSASAAYGPAVLFQSGALTVTTQGTTGPTGSVVSSANIVGVADGPGPFLYQNVSSTCSATEAGTSGSTTIVGGVLETKYDAVTQEPTVTEVIPVNPAVNYTRTGTIDHVGDSYRIVFNEQTVAADGTLTVNAAHMYLLGPTAVGEVIIGQSVCGVTVTNPTTTTAATTTTSAPTTTTSGPTTTTSGPTTTTSGPTTTTSGPTTTTSGPTTTTSGPTTTTSGPTTTTSGPTTTTSGPTTTTMATTTTTAPPGPTCFGEPATIVGTPGDDHILGTNGRDVIVSMGGDDHVVALGGNDLICAGAGADHVVAGAGDDRLDGGDAADMCIGNGGRDTFTRCEEVRAG